MSEKIKFEKEKKKIYPFSLKKWNWEKNLLMKL